MLESIINIFIKKQDRKINRDDKDFIPGIILSKEHPDWVAIAPGMYVQRDVYLIRKYYDERKEASKKYMENLVAEK